MEFLLLLLHIAVYRCTLLYIALHYCISLHIANLFYNGYLFRYFVWKYRSFLMGVSTVLPIVGLFFQHLLEVGYVAVPISFQQFNDSVNSWDFSTGLSQVRYKPVFISYVLSLISWNFSLYRR